LWLAACRDLRHIGDRGVWPWPRAGHSKRPLQCQHDATRAHVRCFAVQQSAALFLWCSNQHVGPYILDQGYAWTDACHCLDKKGAPRNFIGKLFTFVLYTGGITGANNASTISTQVTRAGACARLKILFERRRCPHGHTGKYRTADYMCHECELIRRRRIAKQRPPRDEAANTICKYTRRWMIEPRYLTKYSKLIGCNGAALRAHVESLFTPGMSWENYGRGADRWQLDHKTPLSKFDLHDPERAAAAAHHTNVRPLWSGDSARSFTH
jgi:hypothetical protein